MDSIIWGELPAEIMERVLSFLSVPVLCRMRSVCKTWNELIGMPSFHDLCDRNGRNELYLFMRREEWGTCSGGLPTGIIGTFTFLDVDAGRWYSIQATEFPGVRDNESETRLMAVDDGLVCELTTLRGTLRPPCNFGLSLLDPIAKSRRVLPPPPKFISPGSAIPRVVTVVNNITRSYRVFLLNNLSLTPTDRALPRVYVHEAFTNEWRGIRNLPNSMQGVWADSAVGFQNTVVVAKHESNQLTLFSHNLEDDSWEEVWRMAFGRGLKCRELVVSNNRLFMVLWLSRDGLFPRAQSPLNLPKTMFEIYEFPETVFEMYELLIPENGRKPVVQFSYAQLQQIFGTRSSSVLWTYGYPCFDSNGRCDSVVLVNRSKGHLRRYHLATGSVTGLPPYPLVQPNLTRFRYRLKNMKLRLRNVLVQYR